MAKVWTNRRVLWLGLGAVIGAVTSLLIPVEPTAHASYTAISGKKFDMCTASTIEGAPDAVFILDQATGRLLGAMPNRQGGGIAATFARNLAADFRVADGAEYLMIPADIRPTQTGSIPPANGGVWVAEQKSGVAALYLFPTGTGTNELIPFAQFKWRQSSR